ncbi:MAG: adenosine deaminase [Eubacterium sp.]|nr:adenosine deaminase [Eubacterium sp.]
MDHKKLLKLPKVELHVHLDGSLSSEFISGAEGREVRSSELSVSEDCRSLAEYLEKFTLPLRVLNNAENLKAAGLDFMKTCAADNIRYTEVRFSPLSLANQNMNAEQAIMALLEGLEAGKKKYDIEYNVIVCAMRHFPDDRIRAALRAAREFLGNGVCCADLAGDEAAFPNGNFRVIFEEARKLDLPFVLHAGETGNPDSVLDAIDMGARRLGHGIAMKGHRNIELAAREKGCGVEMCPTSNFQTKAASESQAYPLREFLDLGLKVSISTDNRTVSNTTLTKELERASALAGLTDDEIILLLKNALDTSYADDSTREKLFSELKKA